MIKSNTLLHQKISQGFNSSIMTNVMWEIIEIAPGVYVPNFPSVPSGDYRVYFKLWVVQSYCKLNSDDDLINFPILSHDMVNIQPIHTMVYTNSSGNTQDDSDFDDDENTHKKNKLDISRLRKFGNENLPPIDDSNGKNTAYSRWLMKEEQRLLEEKSPPPYDDSNSNDTIIDRDFVNEELRILAMKNSLLYDESYSNDTIIDFTNEEQDVSEEKNPPPYDASYSNDIIYVHDFTNEEQDVSEENSLFYDNSNSSGDIFDFDFENDEQHILEEDNSPPPYLTLNGTFKRWMVDDNAVVFKKKTPPFIPATSVVSANYSRRMEQENAIVSQEKTPLSIPTTSVVSANYSRRMEQENANIFQGGIQTKNVKKVQINKPTKMYNLKPHK